MNLQKNGHKQMPEKVYSESLKNNPGDLAFSIICSIFFFSLFAGHYSKNFQVLQALNLIKYGIIPVFSFCIYRYYKTGSKAIFYPLILSLLATWFSGFDFAYHWDSVQHVVRAKYYLTHAYSSVGERHSFLYLIWGGFYRLFGESESITHLINMFLGLCGVFGIYAIAKDLYGDFAGFLAFLISFTFPAFFVVNKWAYLDMPFTSFVIITFFFLFKYLNTGSDRFFYLSLLFAFISFGTKDPGLVLFPAIFLSLIVYGRMSKKAFISIAIIFLISILYYFKVMYYSKIMAEFSIITPLRFGTDSVIIWAGFLTHEIAQYIYSGILILSVFAFLKLEEKSKFPLYSLMSVQVLLLIISEMYPSQQVFSFPLLPSGNYIPYYILLGLSILCVLISLGLKQAKINAGKKEIVMLLWIAAFSSFFIINGRVLEYSTKPTLDLIVLDFRYLMPAFPALIILFSSGISRILKTNYSEKARFIVIFIVALTIIFNFITATNLAFYYANSANVRVDGYNELSRQNPELVYTHWPFYYGDGYDIGKLTWKEDGIQIEDIHSNYFDSPSNSTFLLFDTFFYFPEKLVNFKSEKIEAKTYLLSPFTPSIAQELVNTVYIKERQQGSIVLGDGFYNVEYWDNIPTRWIRSNASFYIYSHEDSNTILSLQAESFRYNRTLEIYVNGNSVSKNVVPPTSFQQIESNVTLKKGMNFVSLNVPEGSGKPEEVSGSEEKDQRELSIAIQEIKLKST
ncbi:MAG: glycosyltransferase family 39 protein [Methanosarcina sp.]